MNISKFLAGAVLIGAAFLSVAPTIAVAQTAPAVAPQIQPKPIVRQIVVDVDQPLPTGYKLQKGDVIIFARKSGIVGTDVTVTPQQMLCSQCISMHQVNLFTSPPGYSMILALTGNVSGFQNVDITHRVPGPNNQPTTVIIKLMVQ